MTFKKTKIERSSALKATEASLRNIKICFNQNSINENSWDNFEKIFSTKSRVFLIKQSIFFLSGYLSKSEQGYIDQLKYDKVSSVLGMIQNHSNFETKNDEKNALSFSVPQWQIALVASSLPPCKNTNEFIKFSLEKSHSIILDFFKKGEM
ncbi:hypothetical protein ACE8EZ_20245 [Pantoea deleyi]|uniref:hypothetical protein n=1 Tax=Pantoea TaxID=53335 RepID=UPI0035D47575